MNRTPKSFPVRLLPLRSHRGVINDYFILGCRFALISINYLMFFQGNQPGAQLPAPFRLSAPPALLVYALIALFGLRFLNFRNVNRILSGLDIIMISVSYYYLPAELNRGAFVMYLVGITIEAFVGKVWISLIMGVCATLGFIFAVYTSFPPLVKILFYFRIAFFNLLIISIIVFGNKIKKTLIHGEQEKEESKKQLHRLQALSRIVKEIAGELENDKLLMLIVQKAAELTKAPAAGLILQDSDHIYRIKAVKGLPKSFIDEEINLDFGLPGRVLAEKKTLVEKFPITLSHSGRLNLEHFKSALAAPIWSKGEMMGLLFLLSDQTGQSFSRDDRFLLETLGEHASIAVVNANIYKTTATLSLNDYLTGVGNLRFFHQQLDHCIAIAARYQQSCSLMIVDSDSLKEINDRFGNAQGFLHIKQLAQILKNTIRSSDLIARYDRDMFMIILPQTELTEAIRLGERIQENVHQSPLTIDNQTINPTVCIGVANFPEDASTCKSLIAAVESGLHYAKRLGKNNLISRRTLEFQHLMERN